MKKIISFCVLIMVLVLLLAGCGCDHEWYAATCSAPKTCSLCGETEGSPLPHTWKDATCTNAKTCSVCNATEGNALGHTWQDATCTAPKTCSVCQMTEGEAAGHTWVDANCSAPKTCSVCKITEGEPAEHIWLEATTDAPKTCSICKQTTGSKLKTDSRFTTKSTAALQGTWICDVTLTDEMMGLADFGGADCRMTMKFGNTGKLSMTMRPKDRKDFLKKYKAFTVNLLYATFAEDGLSKEQADQAMLATYGMNTVDYVDASITDADVDKIFNASDSEEVYYVEGGKLFTAKSWKAKFESTAFSITNGKLVIDSVTLEEGGQPLVWKKA